MINSEMGVTNETPKLAERTRKEYLEQIQKKNDDMTFKPSLTPRTKRICKIRGTVTSDDTHGKVK